LKLEIKADGLNTADGLNLSTLQVEGYMYANAQNRMRMRIYNCFNDIKVGMQTFLTLPSCLPRSPLCLEFAMVCVEI
jgi:hypothetical protein